MALKKIDSENPLERWMNVDKIGLLIQNGRYEQAIELLHRAQIHTQKLHLLSTANLLALAQEICMISEQLRAEAEWYEWACQDTARREAKFVQQLFSLIETAMVSELDETVSSSNIISGTYRSVGANPQPESSPPAKKLFGLRNWFGRDAHTENETLPSPAQTALAAVMGAENRLIVYTLGTFQVYHNEELVENWGGRKALTVFKFLLLSRERPIHKEGLIEQFWPDSSEEAGRNNLNVVIYNLRQALRNGDAGFSHILFQNDCYLLNPEIGIWVDYEAFGASCRAVRRWQQAGNMAAAEAEFKLAEMLYQGDFLPEDYYEEWTDAPRQRLQMAYLSLLEDFSRHYFDEKDYPACAAACNKILAVEPSLESAHVRLMGCYSRQGQSPLALRQYDRCTRALAELNLMPALETRQLYERIRAGETV